MGQFIEIYLSAIGAQFTAKRLTCWRWGNICSFAFV